VRQAFDLYATRQYSLRALTAKMRELGLANRRGTPITKNGIWIMLQNPFYIGLLALRRTKETYPGIHEPLIGTGLFDRVQQILHGRNVPRVVKHDFAFRKLFRCGTCRTALIGERQKGHVYYRCHTKGCPMTGIREEKLEEAVLGLLTQLQFREEAKAIFAAALRERGEQAGAEAKRSRTLFACQLGQITLRLDRLTDAYLDQSRGQRDLRGKASTTLGGETASRGGNRLAGRLREDADGRCRENPRTGKHSLVELQNGEYRAEAPYPRFADLEPYYLAKPRCR
jgi:hypothetical protein